MKLPGQKEAETMCRNAAIVHRLCARLGISDELAQLDEFPHLEHELLVDELEAAGGPPDGAWILPEEF